MVRGSDLGSGERKEMMKRDGFWLFFFFLGFYLHCTAAHCFVIPLLIVIWRDSFGYGVFLSDCWLTLIGIELIEKKWFRSCNEPVCVPNCRKMKQ